MTKDKANEMAFRLRQQPDIDSATVFERDTGFWDVEITMLDKNVE